MCSNQPSRPGEKKVCSNQSSRPSEISPKRQRFWVVGSLFPAFSCIPIRASTDHRPPPYMDGELTRTYPCHTSTDGQSSNITLPNLERPLRPFFIHPSSSQPNIPESGYTPIICLSASRWIGITGQRDDVPSVTLSGGRNVGFEYIPGAGDDDELWAKVRYSLRYKWLIVGINICCIYEGEGGTVELGQG